MCPSVHLSGLNSMGMHVEHVVAMIVLIVHTQSKLMNTRVCGGVRPNECKRVLEPNKGRARLGAIGQKEQGRGHEQLGKA